MTRTLKSDLFLGLSFISNYEGMRQTLLRDNPLVGLALVILGVILAVISVKVSEKK